MDRLLIVYPNYNEVIGCYGIIRDEKGYICYTQQAPRWAENIKTCDSFKVEQGVMVCNDCGRKYQRIPADDMVCNVTARQEIEQPEQPAKPTKWWLYNNKATPLPPKVRIDKRPY